MTPTYRIKVTERELHQGGESRTNDLTNSALSELSPEFGNQLAAEHGIGSWLVAGKRKGVSATVSKEVYQA